MQDRAFDVVGRMLPIQKRIREEVSRPGVGVKQSTCNGGRDSVGLGAGNGLRGKPKTHKET
jgi:hypothetical protein